MVLSEGDIAETEMKFQLTFSFLDKRWYDGE